MPLPYSADEGGEEGGHGPCVSTRLLLSNYDSPTSTLGGNSAERCVLLNYLRDAHLQSTPLPIFEPFRAHSTDKMSSEKKDKLEPQIKSVDMTEDMQQEAVEVAIEAMEKYHIEKDIAQYIKREFDSRKGATWHCVVGRNFGSFVTHETKHFIYFYLGHCAILLFKTQ